MKTFFQENKVYILGLGGIVLLCVGGIFLQKSQSSSGTMASLKQGGTVLWTLDLTHVDPFEEEILGENGQYNRILVEQGQVSMVEANCPDQICVIRGVNNGSSGPIVCLPHQVIISFIGEDYDEISG